jgi:hypothetical protein
VPQGYGCGIDDYSGVYSRISGVHEWIAQQICILSDSPPDGCSGGEDGGGGGGDGDGGGGDVDGPEEGSVLVKLSVKFDDYPAESSFTVTSTAGGEKQIVVNRPSGSFTTPDGLYEEDMYLLPGVYELEFKDSAGDGICCTFGEGGYELRAILEDGIEEGVVLFGSNGSFGEIETTPFTVPESVPGESTPTASSPAPSPADETETTSSPTPSPVDGTPSPSQPTTPVPVGCSDDATGTVFIDSDVGEKSCEWIGQNMARYNYLCQFLDIAFTCKATCSACEYFA